MYEIISFCKKRWNVHLEEETYFGCADFLFYTSWFEEILYNQNTHRSDEHDKKIARDLCHMIDISKFEFLGNYFSGRYVDNDSKPTNYFKQLRLNQNHQENVFNILNEYKNQKAKNEDLLWAYIVISYRFRNNMFHGNKGAQNLNNYIVPIKKINIFLNTLLSSIIENGYKGYN